MIDIAIHKIVPHVLCHISELDAALAELERQGLMVRLHSGKDNTWHIADEGLYSGYVVRADELVDLRKVKKLNIQGIDAFNSFSDRP